MNRPAGPDIDARYRADIDGLRAVAVLAVVVFHLFPRHLPGGFVGVDVFFVISGYLITGVIARELDAGHFSFADFYRRRIKRLLPASIAVSLATVLGAAWLLVPLDFVYFTTSLAAAWAFASNVFFSLLSGGYFDRRFEVFPFLHTWSLGVEEQFYFVFPALLLGLWRLPRRTLAVAALLLLMVGLAWWLRDQPRHYYLLTTRAHQLLAGALLALLPSAWSAGLSRGLAAALCVVGVALLAGAFIVFSGALAYPGLYALVPTLGAALLIFAVPRAPWASAVLSARVPVTLGLMSYSIYLWHWPLIALLRYRGVEIKLPVGLAAFVIVIALSHASWRWIEQPARRSDLGLRAALLRFYAVPAALVFTLAAASHFTAGLPQRFPAELRTLIESYSQERDLARQCSTRVDSEPRLDLPVLARECAFGVSEARPSILLYGDSHASHFKPLLDVLARDAGLGGVYSVMGSCAPVRADETSRRDACARRNAAARSAFGEFRYVVISGEWDPALREADFLALVDAVRAAGATPVLVADSPASSQDRSRCVLHRARGWINTSSNCDIPMPEVRARADAVDTALRSVQAQRPDVKLLDVKPLLCSASGCATSVGALAVYRDSNHLNAQASAELGRRLIERRGNPLR